ncbi:probable G-protein coupled receptor 158 [Anopheles cruzii]|nr:probable G-protein coupled receptor 158 [Anopheles cruzii]
MNMLQLDVNQCPDNYYEPNAFKNTHKCDVKSSYCVPILGRGYETGGYKCECLQGFEYPYEDLITYYDGQLVEAEFDNIVQDKESRYDTFKCRLAGAAALQVELTILVFVTLFGWIMLRRNQC